MPVIEIVRQLLAPEAVSMHRKRLDALHAAVTAVIMGRNLAVSAMGRAFWGVTTAKHSIRRFDRLVSKPHLLAEVQALATRLIQQKRRLIISIDWSHLTGVFHALVATATLDGRSVMLLGEVRPEEQFGNALVQKRFLKALKAVLSPGCRPVIVSDAGLHGLFFRAVLSVQRPLRPPLRGRRPSAR